jgi:pimeloyl-ACP methyl ester carboxylesterase
METDVRRTPGQPDGAGAPTVEVTHRTLGVNGLQMHIAEAGTGPLVLLLHGWPESWYSWRHQIPALAGGPRKRSAVVW